MLIDKLQAVTLLYGLMMVGRALLLKLVMYRLIELLLRAIAQIKNRVAIARMK